MSRSRSPSKVTLVRGFGGASVGVLNLVADAAVLSTAMTPAFVTGSTQTNALHPPPAGAGQWLTLY